MARCSKHRQDAASSLRGRGHVDRGRATMSLGMQEAAELAGHRERKGLADRGVH